LGGWIATHILGQRIPPSPFVVIDASSNGKDLEKSGDSSDKGVQPAEAPEIDDIVGDVHEAVFVEDNDPEVSLARQVTHLSARSFRSRRTSGRRPSSSRPGVSAPRPAASLQTPRSPAAPLTSRPPSSRVPFLSGALKIVAPLRVVITPITLTIAVSLPIALITPLKALFVDVFDVTDKYSRGSWRGPDGKPVLNFVIDTGGSLMGYNISSPY
jgi:auxin efflux carrier family protein